MTMNRLQKLVLTTALVMTAAFAHADVQKVTVINPECLENVTALDNALQKAHAEGKFTQITINRNEPVIKEMENCNMTFEVSVKSMAEVEKLQADFRAYMMKDLKFKMYEPTITHIN